MGGIENTNHGSATENGYVIMRLMKAQSGPDKTERDIKR